ERRKPVASVRAKRKGHDGHHRLEVEGPVEMRKEVARACRFEAQCGPEPLGVDCNEQEIVLSLEMACGCLNDLGGRGEVDEAVFKIDGRAAEQAVLLGRCPECGRNYLVDGGHELP